MFVHHILTRHHRALVTRAELRAQRRNGLMPPGILPIARAEGSQFGTSMLLVQLAKAMLGNDAEIHRLGALAGHHGEELARRGEPVAAVVHAYGDIRQALNELQRDLQLQVSANQLWQLEGLLEDSLACALTAYERTRAPSAGRLAASARTFDYALHHLVQLARLALESARLDHDLDASLVAGPLGRSIRALIALLARRDAQRPDELFPVSSSAFDAPPPEVVFERTSALHAP